MALQVVQRGFRSYDVIVVGASLGGLDALSTMLSRLPISFAAPIVLAQHRATSGHLDKILQNGCALNVREAREGDRVMPGSVYLIPAGHRGTLGRDRRIALAPALEGRISPSIDELFCSAADAYRDRAIAVVLSGRLHDGANGVREIKRRGGRVLVQDESSAKCFEMPAAALATGCVDFALPSARIASALTALVMVPGASAFFAVPLPPWARLG